MVSGRGGSSGTVLGRGRGPARGVAFGQEANGGGIAASAWRHDARELSNPGEFASWGGPGVRMVGSCGVTRGS